MAGILNTQHINTTIHACARAYVYVSVYIFVVVVVGCSGGGWMMKKDDDPRLATA